MCDVINLQEYKEKKLAEKKTNSANKLPRGTLYKPTLRSALEKYGSACGKQHQERFKDKIPLTRSE